MGSDSDEVLVLRRATRDMIAITALPSIWAFYNVNQIANSLVETLARSLFLEFAYLQVNGSHERIRVGYSQSQFLADTSLDNLDLIFEPWLSPGQITTSTRSIPNPFGNGEVKINFAPIGYNFKNGVLITGTSRPQFPTESERLILNVATNQTSIIVEYKWAQIEAQKLLKIAEEKEIKLREMSKLAEIAKIEAVNANELKSSFLANMSHEIRTPLGAILGFTDVLKNSSLSPQERSEYLEIIYRSGQSLTKIIDDILDLSKIEAGKLEMETLPLSIADICKEVILMFSDRATGKGIELTFDESQLPKFNVVSDPARIRQVLVNLIGNAIKFTSQGSINLVGRYTETVGGKIRVSLSVIDTGAGMSEAVAASLFKPFIQGDNTSTRKFGGTGLGLALSKKLGNALGGDVFLTRCEENKGCTFTFEFLAPKANRSQSNELGIKGSSLKEEKSLAGYKILVADDSPDNRLLMNLILTRKGATVEFAQDGEEAVQIGLSKEFDVVLMDIQMPKLDGYGALASLRKAGFRKPVFALTAHAMTEERNRAIASGFVDHVPKPISPELLIDSILMHVHLG